MNNRLRDDFERERETREAQIQKEAEQRLAERISKLHYVFISYTTREEEFKTVERLTQAIVDELHFRGLKPSITQFIWLDRLEIRREVDADIIEWELSKGLDESGKVLSFLSPEYWKSEWCRFEWNYAISHNIPIGSIVWKGDNPISEWAPPDPRLMIDARPFFRTGPIIEPHPVPRELSRSWQADAFRSIDVRLTEYLLFRKLVDIIYDFLVGEWRYPYYQRPSDAEVLWRDLRY